MQLYWVLYSTSFVPTYRSFPIEKARKVFFFFLIIILIGFGQFPNPTRTIPKPESIRFRRIPSPILFSPERSDNTRAGTIRSVTHYPSGFWPSLLLPSQRTCILSSFSLIKPVKEKDGNRENGLYIWVKILVNE